MKLHLRDRFTALLGIGLLSVMVLASYYYALQGEIDNLRQRAKSDIPDYVAHDIAVTEFREDGVAVRRVFADYAEHYGDGRLITRKPRMATLFADKPQVKASSDTGTSLDAGKTAVFTGNVVVTRAGDLTHAPMRFTTDHLTVYPDDSRMETDAFVRLESSTDVTTGRGMTFDNVDRTVQILSDVRTVVLPKGDTVTLSHRDNH